MASLIHRCVIVKGLSRRISREEVSSMFETVGPVHRILFRLDLDHNFHGEAYVIFNSPDFVTTACEELTEGVIQVKAATMSLAADVENLLEENEMEEEFLQSYKKLTPARRKLALSRLVEERSAVHEDLGTRVKEEPVTPVQQREDSTTMKMYQDVPRLPSFSGEGGKDASYGRWRYEVMCLVKEQYPMSVVKNAIRKSLKSPAAEVLRRLGDVGVDQMLVKFQSLYGTVFSGEALLQRFYSEKQSSSESSAEWSCRLEDYMYEAIERGVIGPEAAHKSLGSRFWSGLRDDKVKNALRHREDTLSFEELVMEARRVEEEYCQTSEEMKFSKPVKVQQVSASKEASSDDKLDIIIKRLAQVETQISEMKARQGAGPIQAQGATSSAPVAHPSYGYGPWPSQPPIQQGQGGMPRRDRSSMRCLKCELPGHMAFGCRQGKNVTCYNCQREGHISASCLNC